MADRIEVKFKTGVKDALGESVCATIERDLQIKLQRVQTVDVFTLDKDLSKEQVELCRVELFTDPLTQYSRVNSPIAEDFDWIIEIGFLPGVTDNVGRTSKEGIKDLLKIEFAEGEAVYFSRQYLLSGKLARKGVERIAGYLHNPLIERSFIKSHAEFKHARGIHAPVPRVKLPVSDRVDEVNLEVSDDELIRLGKEGILDHVEPDGAEIRRGPLALDLEALYIIRDHFRAKGRNPTDVEVESIAQTWSEHCKHTIFAAQLDEINSVYRSHIKDATGKIRARLGKDDWCLSVFTDNSGVIRFTEGWDLCYKVETHNSPSALDPYGGAITGIVGVNRDPMGTGQGARLVINIYGFCFGDPYYKGELPYRGRDRARPILHPRAIFEGVRRGVEHGGNKSGIPTPWGFLIFDERYMGKPLVYVGTVGLLPAEINGRPSYSKKAQAGDYIVMAGGRVGKDGIHGATFSSESLHEGSPAAAVQIGDPITQKKMHDAQIEARDRGLYNSLTDNGAGGLSCSVGEMARECGGCEVDLEKVPIKYSGLLPSETWISESQERMTYSVPPENLAEFLALMQTRDVEATVIGRFNDSGLCKVYLHGKTIMDVDLEFLHEGLPQRKLKSKWKTPRLPLPRLPKTGDMTQILYHMAGRLNICSKEYVVRQFDHEVQGGSVIKPLIGVNDDVHSDAVVIRPLLESLAGVAMSCGVLPWYGDIDPYAMASCGIDTALRNVVAVGADPDRIALLDNFCWCSSDEPERLGQLRRATLACYETALAYRTPFISGKDSMYNDFKGFDGKNNPVKISVPPTLLISSLGKVNDIRKCVSLDAKSPGDLVYVLGETRDECGGSEYFAYLGEKECGSRMWGMKVPRVDTGSALMRYRKIHRAIEDGVLASCHAVGMGGLGMGFARIAMAGDMGLDLDLSKVPKAGKLRRDKILFSESQSRFVVTVSPDDQKRFEDIMSGDVFALVGRVIEDRYLVVKDARDKLVLRADVRELSSRYKKTLGW